MGKQILGKFITYQLLHWRFPTPISAVLKGTPEFACKQIKLLFMFSVTKMQMHLCSS